MRRLNDNQLRAAAAARPGYATYPQYAPTGPERLAPYWQGPARPAGYLELTGPLSAAEVEALKRTFAERLGERVRLAVLPPSPVFEFHPRRSPGRPWWRRRWNWAVMPATGRPAWGYCWTEAGARRRSERAARKAKRRG